MVVCGLLEGHEDCEFITKHAFTTARMCWTLCKIYFVLWAEI